MYKIKNIFRGPLEFKCDVEPQSKQTILKIYNVDKNICIKIATLSVAPIHDKEEIEYLFVEYVDNLDISKNIKESILDVDEYSYGNIQCYTILYESVSSFELCTRIYRDDKCIEEICNEFDTNGLSLVNFYKNNEKMLKMFSCKNIFKEDTKLLIELERVIDMSSDKSFINGILFTIDKIKRNAIRKMEGNKIC